MTPTPPQPSWDIQIVTGPANKDLPNWQVKQETLPATWTLFCSVYAPSFAYYEGNYDLQIKYDVSRFQFYAKPDPAINEASKISNSLSLLYTNLCLGCTISRYFISCVDYCPTLSYTLMSSDWQSKGRSKHTTQTSWIEKALCRANVENELNLSLYSSVHTSMISNHSVLDLNRSGRFAGHILIMVLRQRWCIRCLASICNTKRILENSIISFKGGMQNLLFF